MITNVIAALRSRIAKPFDAALKAVGCRHNYVTHENQFGKQAAHRGTRLLLGLGWPEVLSDAVDPG
jgi:hypothetical protein